MFGIGLPELIIIMVVALIIIGPSKLPDLAKALGKGMAEFRKATQDIKESLDLDQDFEEAKEDLADAIGDVNRPLDVEALEETETPKYQDYDELLEAHEKEMQETPEAKEDLVDPIADVNRPLDGADPEETETPKSHDYDEVPEAHKKEMQETRQEENMEEEAPKGDLDKNGA